MKNEEKQKFQCEKCGLCCENLDKSSLYDDLNDGTGICIYYDMNTHLCRIYENRPDKCNVDKYYQYVKEFYTYEEYLELNYESCKRLKGGF